MSISNWPSARRPREKLLATGAQSLTDAELLAIFLRTGVKGMSAVDLADRLISDFGSISDLLRADSRSFCSGHGLGPAKYVQLQAVLELSRRHLHEQLKRGDAMTDSNSVKEYLGNLLKNPARELFHALFLDNQHRLIASETLFQGTISSATVHPRELVRRALALNASATIVAHNHPSGVAEPSQADRRITEQIRAALEMVEVRLLDHLIVGDTEVVSFAELGLM